MALGCVGAVAAGAARRARRALDGVAGAADAVVRTLIEAVLDRVDLDALVSRVDVNLIVERVDVNQVAERVDVDQVADRLDIDAVIARIDLVGLTRDVLNEIDIGRIVRDTGGGMAAETGEAIRLLGRRGDRTVNQLADRLLGRAVRDARAAGRKSSADEPATPAEQATAHAPYTPEQATADAPYTQSGPTS
ncbi:hypothetical protein ACQB60_15070 [Actinomycetota bacterium Odt1-20B]